MSDPTDFDPTSTPVDVTPDAGDGHVSRPAGVPVFETKRHPYRGLFAAIPLALGVVIILIVTKTIELSLTPMIAAFVIVLVLGTLWGTFGPASKPKGAPPAEPSPPTRQPTRQPTFSPPEPGTPESPSTKSTDWSAPPS